jgi:protein TonB
MEANSILHADMLDILFENRYKEYGAYDLRKTYNKRVAKAVTLTFMLCLLLAVANIFAGSKKNFIEPPIVIGDVHLTKVDQPKQQIKVPQMKQPAQIATRKDATPVIVHEKDFKKEDKVSPADIFDNVKIGPVNQGEKDGNILAPPVAITTGGVELKNNKRDFEQKFIVDQREAKFPGGINAWIEYLERNLRTKIPVDNGAPAGTYTVKVVFLVDQDGNISDVQAVNDPGYGTAGEAVRVIKKSRQWNPAIQNGNPVVYRQVQTITFVVQEQ